MIHDPCTYDKKMIHAIEGIGGIGGLGGSDVCLSAYTRLFRLEIGVLES